MSLELFEVVPTNHERAAVEGLLDRVGRLAQDAGGEIVEAQVTQDHGRAFVIVEAPEASVVDTLRSRLSGEALDGEARELTGPHQVRLVGADLAEIKAQRPRAGYLVEWDLPAEMDMDTYLTRKRINAPKYAEVPEATFLRTYVREDMDKCLCFYDAPDEGVVRAAREAVSSPIDRLHRLDGR